MDNTKDILAAVRCHKGFTADRIARELGIAITTYQSYERGAALPPIKVLSKLADIYGLTTDQLIGRASITKKDIEGMAPHISQTDLKDFAKAAMQGLCSGVNVRELTANEVESIAYSAGDIAERTLLRLSELQKQQS